MILVEMDYVAYTNFLSTKSAVITGKYQTEFLIVHKRPRSDILPQ